MRKGELKWEKKSTNESQCQMKYGKKAYMWYHLEQYLQFDKIQWRLQGDSIHCGYIFNRNRFQSIDLPGAFSQWYFDALNRLCAKQKHHHHKKATINVSMEYV